VVLRHINTGEGATAVIEISTASSANSHIRMDMNWYIFSSLRLDVDLNHTSVALSDHN